MPLRCGKSCLVVLRFEGPGAPTDDLRKRRQIKPIWLISSAIIYSMSKYRSRSWYSMLKDRLTEILHFSTPHTRPRNGTVISTAVLQLMRLALSERVTKSNDCFWSTSGCLSKLIQLLPVLGSCWRDVSQSRLCLTKVPLIMIPRPSISSSRRCCSVSWLSSVNGGYIIFDVLAEIFIKRIW
jgi:hypothetical protein